MRNTQLLEKIDAAIAEKSLSETSLLPGLANGQAEPRGSWAYAAQYYRHVEAFPTHFRVLAARTEGPIRDIILENLAEEENPSLPHPKLWRDFAAILGVNDEDITACPALPGTQAVVETFREIVGDRPVAEAVAALYAYEAQVPEIATTKIEGLRKFYGIHSPKGTCLFHRALERPTRPTARLGAAGLEEHAHGDEEEILATTNQALDALWGALDAVHCAHA